MSQLISSLKNILTVPRRFFINDDFCSRKHMVQLFVGIIHAIGDFILAPYSNPFIQFLAVSIAAGTNEQREDQYPHKIYRCYLLQAVVLIIF